MLLSVSKCNDFHNPNSVTNCLSLISIAFYSYYLYLIVKNLLSLETEWE